MKNIVVNPVIDQKGSVPVQCYNCKHEFKNAAILFSNTQYYRNLKMITDKEIQLIYEVKSELNHLKTEMKSFQINWKT